MTVLDPDGSLDTDLLEPGQVYFVLRAYPYHIEVMGDEEINFLIFFDQLTPGDIGYRATASAFSRGVLSASFGVSVRELPHFPFTSIDPLIVSRNNPIDQDLPARTPIMTSTLTVTDHGTTLDFTYEDALRYHGPQAPGGVAHAYKVLERALGVLGGEGSVERRDLVVATPHGGPGVRDAFELVTRAVTEGRYTVDSSLARPERGNALALYVFRIHYRDASVTLTIREGFVVDEFITLARKGDRTAEDEARLTALKQEMADRVMSSPAESVYDVEVDTLPA